MPVRELRVRVKEARPLLPYKRFWLVRELDN
jgi:hypothetical protein